MAIVTSFFDQQRAGEINSIINNNFTNVAKYIPVHFDSLTTVERLNLGDDWKQDGKLVYDMDQELVYIWDADSVEWVQHLLEAKDSYARALAEENRRTSFASVTLDENCQLIFKNSLGATIGTQLLTSDKIQYDSTDTIYSKIGKLMEQDEQMTEDIAQINSKIGTTTLPTSSQTITGAISEIHGEVDVNTEDIENIKSGDIVVGKADHANTSDMASDSEKLGGQLPNYYAPQSSLDATNQNVSNNSANIATNASDIADLQSNLAQTNDKVEANYNEFLTFKDMALDDNTRLDTVENDISSLQGAVIPKGSVNSVSGSTYETDLTQYIYDTYYNGYIYKGKTALTAGSEASELNEFVGGTPQNNWAVLDTNTQNTWVYNGSWSNVGILIKTGWAVRDAATADMWVYEADGSTWVNFGGSFEIVVANTTTAGIVKASSDVNVASDGTMSVPALTNKADKSNSISSGTIAQNSQDTGATITLKTESGTTKSTLELQRKNLNHRIYGTQFMSNRTTLQFQGNVEITDDEENDRTVVTVTNGSIQITGVQLVDEDYTITLAGANSSYQSPTLVNYNSATDTIKLFMNGAYIPKSNYSITVSNSNIATVTNLNHTTSPWLEGWELTFLVTRVVATTE